MNSSTQFSIKKTTFRKEDTWYVTRTIETPSLIVIFQAGTSLRSSIAPHIHKLFDCVVASTATHPREPSFPPFNVLLVYELIPLKKINSVAPDATAFRSRGPQANIVMVVDRKSVV